MTSARDLTSRLASLLRDERKALADFLVLLADFDRRRQEREAAEVAAEVRPDEAPPRREVVTAVRAPVATTAVAPVLLAELPHANSAPPPGAMMSQAPAPSAPPSPGGICGSTLRPELDHVVPEAAGGPSTVDNLRILCRVHNQSAARRWLGNAWMDRFTRRASPPGDAIPGPRAAAPEGAFPPV